MKDPREEIVHTIYLSIHFHEKEPTVLDQVTDCVE